MSKKETLIQEFELYKERFPENKYGFINKDPMSETSFIGRFFFSWAFRIILLSKKTLLKTEYLGVLSPKMQSKVFFNNIYNIWDKMQYRHYTKCALFLTAVRANISSLSIVMFFTFISSILNILGIHFFRTYIKMFINEAPVTRTHIIIGILYIVVKFFDFFTQRKTTQLLHFIGDKSAVELKCLIYDKLLKLSSSNEIKSGDVCNYLQNDSRKLFLMMSMCPNVLTIPFLIIMYNYLLFKYMGISFIYGFGVMIIFLILNYHFRKKFSLYLGLHMKKSDQRMRISIETFNNLKVIKLNGWDDAFLNKIQSARDEELQALEKRYQITQVSQTLLWLAPIAMSVVAIGAYQVINDSFKIEDMFTCLGIFTSIQSPMQLLPATFDSIIESLNSLKRIEKFLKLPEVNPSIVTREVKDEGIAIRIENGNFTWGGKKQSDITEVNKSESKEKEKINKLINLSFLSSNSVSSNNNKAKLIDRDEKSSQPKYKVNNAIEMDIILKNINIQIKKGEFICIIGEVGSGKSSLLQAILNNMTIVNPKQTKLIVNGDISYVSQESWIQNTTLKNNILFYHPFDLVKYNKIIDICELRQDLNILVGGDLTEIGEKGVNLSGGQKARISIARALYSDKDIFFLDDPISSLDAHVGKNIMMNCIVGYLHNKTRILVTHALQYASYADRIIYMQNGEIKWTGNYDELLTQHFYQSFLKKVNQYKNKNSNEYSYQNSKNINNINNISNGQVKRITKDEARAFGTIDKRVFFTYLKYIGGIFLILILLLVLFIWQSLKIGSDMWLGYWSEHQFETKKFFYFAIYASLALGSTLFNYFRTFLITKGSLKCSTRLHREMIKNLIDAPINLFHDTVPKGQIFNKLSKDLPTVDSFTMYWFMTLNSFGSSFLGAVIVCSIYQPDCLFFLPFFTALCWFLSRFFMNCSRELTRIEGMLNSPILNIINETIPGSTTIRAYKFEEKYINNFQSKINEHFKVRIYLVGIYQWYMLMLNILSCIFLAFLIVFTLIYKQTFSAKEIGILLTYSIVLQESLIQFLSSFANFENTMTNMERSLSYGKIISEKMQLTQKDKEYYSWPSKGKIEFIDYSVKYRPDTELVLKNISFTINAGEHLGIVGRTGSGKSTIALCLFRILEAFSGKILIDDVDISTLGLKKLRSSLTIIPQDSTLMTGSLRYNIDPLNAYSDSDIIHVIKQIGFSYIIDNNPKGLQQSISENGGNLSIGEKQLICITRAILRVSIQLYNKSLNFFYI